MASLLALARSKDGMDRRRHHASLTSEQLRTIHGKFDADQNGKASLHEVKSFAQAMSLDIARKQVPKMLTELDTSHDGKISLEEILKDLESISADGEVDEETAKQMSDERLVLTARFEVADANKDGQLDLEEMPAYFWPDTHPGTLTITAEAMLKKMDRDGSGTLSSEEFWESEEHPNFQQLDAEGVEKLEEKTFRRLDKNRDGVLDLEEYKVWKSGAFLTEQALHKMFKVSDTNRDMHITADELDRARKRFKKTHVLHHLLEWRDHYEL